MLSVQEKIKIIMKSKKISDVQTTEIMPESVAVAAYFKATDLRKEYARHSKRIRKDEKRMRKDAKKRLKKLKEQYGGDSKIYLNALAEYEENYVGNEGIDEYESLYNDDCYIETLVFENGNYFGKSSGAATVKKLNAGKGVFEKAMILAETVKLYKMKNSCKEMRSLKKIYIRDQGQKVRLKHNRQAQSDREGYLLFEKK